MNFERSGNKPHFTFEELQEIYAHTQKKETSALRETAHISFPDRNPITYENLYIGTGPSREFIHNGEYRNPKWVLVSHPVMTSVMDNDTIYFFVKKGGETVSPSSSFIEMISSQAVRPAAALLIGFPTKSSHPLCSNRPFPSLTGFQPF